MPAGGLTEHGWRSKPSFKGGVAALAFDADTDADVKNDEHDNDGDDPADAASHRNPKPPGGVVCGGVNAKPNSNADSPNGHEAPAATTAETCVRRG